MSGTAVMIAIADQDLRRSVEFVLQSVGHRPIAGIFPKDAGRYALSIVEDSLLDPSLPCARETGSAVIVLSDHQRPAGCPLAWQWLVTPHLGEALHRAILRTTAPVGEGNY